MAELNLAKFGKIETFIWLFRKFGPGNTVTPLMYGSNRVPWHEQVWMRCTPTTTIPISFRRLPPTDFRFFISVIAFALASLGYVLPSPTDRDM